MWVSLPQEFTENSGFVDPSEVPGWPTFKAATLQCQPHFMDWSTVAALHVFDRLIVPGATYNIQVVDELCGPDRCRDLGPDVFSQPLTLSTSVWGDVLDNCETTPCGPPDGSIDVTTDVTGILDKFKNSAGAPIKSRCDLEPEIPDFKINISDVTFSLDAFRGRTYPFTDSGTVPCP